MLKKASSLKLRALVKKSTVKPVSIGQIEGGNQRVTMSAIDRYAHAHIVGSTGTGKSKLLEHIVRQWLNSPNGMCLMDPHGLLYKDLLIYISTQRPDLSDRVILFDPAGDDDSLLGFNPIPKGVRNIDYITNMMMTSIIKSMGGKPEDFPRISSMLRLIFYPVIKHELTILETVPFLYHQHKDRRFDLLKGVYNEQVLSGWADFEKLPPREQKNYIEGPSNRLVSFLENHRIREIISQRDTVFDLTEVMNSGKILLCNLAGGNEIPRENCQLLGIMLVNEFFRVAKLRDPHDPNLKPFNLIIDEFAQYVTRDIAYALEETRKFGLFLTLAHQHLAQLKKEDEYLYASVMTNCKHKMVFGGLSVEDATIMSQEVMTGFQDLKRIKDEIYVTKMRQREVERTVKVNLKSNAVTNEEGGGSSEAESSGTLVMDGNSSQVSNSTDQNRSSKKAKNTQIMHSRDYGARDQKRSGSSDESTSGQRTTTGNAKTQMNQYTQNTGTIHTDHSNWSRRVTEGQQEGFNIIPFHETEEFTELASRTFWSLEEIQYMQMARMKNLDTGYALVKLNGQKPVEVKIDHVNSVFYDPEHTPQRVKEFTQAVIQAHEGYYKSAYEARLSYETRQRELFSDGEPLVFDEPPIVIEQPKEEAVEDDSPFNV